MFMEVGCWIRGFWVENNEVNGDLWVRYGVRGNLGKVGVGREW
jgi:hypothetical protein